LAILTRTTTVERSLSGSNGSQWSNRRQKRKSTSPIPRNLADRNGRYYNKLHH
jgi:hypothetical protein